LEQEKLAICNEYGGLGGQCFDENREYLVFRREDLALSESKITPLPVVQHLLLNFLRFEGSA